MSILCGSFLIWEPDGKSPPGHRLLDSERPATSLSQHGMLSTDGETLFFVKDRYAIWVLAFLASTPLWGGAAIGLGFLFEWMAKSFVDSHPALLLITSAALAISIAVLIIAKIFKPIRRQYPRSQIANARIKYMQQFRNNAPTAIKGLMAVDFSVIPPGAFVEGNGSVRTATAGNCTFVTFIALSEAQAKSLCEWLPKTEVALAGKLNPDIPPQQVAPKAFAQTESAAERTSSNAGAKAEKKYSHNIKLWIPIVSAMVAGFLDYNEIAVAVKNHQGLIINGIIHLGPMGATILYYFFAVLVGSWFLFSAAIVLRSIFNPHSLLVSPDGVTFFEGWLPRRAIIPFQSIDSSFQQQNLKGGSRTLVLGVKGRRFQVHEDFLKDRRAYDEINQAIEYGRKNARIASAAAAAKPAPPDDSRYMPKQ